MRFLRPVAAAAFVAVLSPALAQQQPATPDPERLRLSSDLIELTTVKNTMQSFTVGTSTTIVQAFTQQLAAQKAAITDAQKKAIDEAVRINMAKKLPELITVLAPQTANVFTADELKAMVDFYKSPVGQKIIEKMPAFQAVQARLAGQWLQQNSPVIERTIFTELEQKGIKVQRPQGQGQQPARP